MNFNELIKSGKDLTEKEKEELQVYINDIDNGGFCLMAGFVSCNLVLDENDSSKTKKAILIY